MGNQPLFNDTITTDQAAAAVAGEWLKTASKNQIKQELKGAVQAGHDETVAILAPFCSADFLCKALLLAADEGYTRIIEHLMPRVDPLVDDGESLFRAAANGHVEATRLLMAWTDPRGMTPNPFGGRAFTGMRLWLIFCSP